MLAAMSGHHDDHHGRHHDHDHSELSETELRVRALEIILTEKGYVDPAALDPEGYFAYRARLAGDTDGYTVELRELWQGDRLIALNQQMFAAL